MRHDAGARALLSIIIGGSEQCHSEWLIAAQCVCSVTFNVRHSPRFAPVGRGDSDVLIDERFKEICGGLSH